MSRQQGSAREYVWLTSGSCRIWSGREEVLASTLTLVQADVLELHQVYLVDSRGTSLTPVRLHGEPLPSSEKFIATRYRVIDSAGEVVAGFDVLVDVADLERLGVQKPQPGSNGVTPRPECQTRQGETRPSPTGTDVPGPEPTNNERTGGRPERERSRPCCNTNGTGEIKRPDHFTTKGLSNVNHDKPSERPHNRAAGAHLGPACGIGGALLLLTAVIAGVLFGFLLRMAVDDETPNARPRAIPAVCA